MEKAVRPESVDRPVQRLLAVAIVLGLCACGGVGGDGKCLLRAEAQPDGSVAFIDVQTGVKVATCDAAITSCTQSNGLPVDARMMQACYDTGPTTPAPSEAVKSSPA